MSKNILIYRTDRIGDLILTCPSIITIGKYFENANLTLIASDNNYEYAKKLNIFKTIYKYPKYGFFKKIYFLLSLRKKNYDYVFVFDGKERSIISAYFVNSKRKVALTQKIKFYYKYLNISFCNDSNDVDLQTNYQNMFYKLNIKKIINNYNFLLEKEDNNYSSKIPIKKYIHIHLDEKWFSKSYIKDYEDIYPKYEDFVDFLYTISKKNDVLITTGLIDLEIINDLKEKFFDNLDGKIFYKKNFNNSIYLIYKPSFDDIESLLKNSKLLVACHGSITHAANSFEVRKIDIIEYKRDLFYKRFTLYLKNYHPIYREQFSRLSIRILNLIKV